jgi:hypothetical protein
MSAQIRHVEYDLAESLKLETYELVDHLTKWETSTRLPSKCNSAAQLRFPSIKASDEEASSVPDKKDL